MLETSLAEWMGLLTVVLISGAAAGVIAGLLGVGGGIVIVPVFELALRLLGYDAAITMHVAIATSMATIVPTSIASSRAHAGRGGIDFGVVRRWSPWIVLGAVGGTVIAARLPGTKLALIFGALALLMAVKMLLPLEHVVLRQRPPAGWTGALIPLSIGGLSAALGIGGGTMSVPTLSLFGEPIHRAVGTAALLGLWISLPAATGYLFATAPAAPVPVGTIGLVNLPGVAVLAPMMWIMTAAGVRIAHRLPARALSMSFGAFLLVVAARMIFRALA